VLTLGVILILKGKLKKISRNELIRIIAVGALVALHWVAFYGSVKYGNVSIAVVCISGAGFFTAFLDPLISGRKLSLVEIMLGAVAIAGIYIIFDFHPQFKLGILFGILSAILYSFFSIFNKQLVVHHSPEILTLYELGGGLIVLTLVVPFYVQFFPAAYYWPTGSDWLWLLIMAWFCTVLSFDLQLNALQKLSAFTINLSYNLEPVYGIILAFIIFNENKTLNINFYTGVGLILAAVIMQMWRVWYARRKLTVV
jgi:drug/metabolite transporter (DMT)-like permease